MNGYGLAWFLTSCSITAYGPPSDECLEWLLWTYTSAQRIEARA